MRLGRAEHGLLFAIGLFLVIWVTMRFPEPLQFLHDSDAAHQLAGAQQVIGGEHPFVAFRASYGPLVFYVSALGQLLSGNRVIGELALDVLGNLLAYLALAVLLFRATSRRSLSLLLIAVAILSISRTHKYWIVLSPVLTLLCAWRYIEKPTRPRLLWLAGATVMSGLFRQDLGVYALAGGVAAVVLADGHGGGRVARRLTEYCLGLAVLLAPYLIWLAARGGLESYLWDSLSISVSKSAGMSLPFPAFHWSRPLLAAANAMPWLYAYYYVQPLVGLVLYLALRHGMEPGQRARWITALIMSSALLMLGYRPDYWHLLQAIPVSFVLCGMILDRLLLKPGQAGGRRLAAGYAWIALTCLSLVLTLANVRWPPVSVRLHVDKITAFAKPKQRFLKFLHREDPDDWAVRLSLRLRACLEPEERLLVVPYFPGLYYFSDRRFAGQQMLTAAGYFDSVHYQRMAIGQIERQDVPVIVAAPEFAFDARPERTIGVTHPILWGYLSKAYAGLKLYGGYTLSVRRRLDRARAMRLKRCFAGPQAADRGASH